MFPPDQVVQKRGREVEGRRPLLLHTARVRRLGSPDPRRVQPSKLQPQSRAGPVHPQGRVRPYQEAAEEEEAREGEDQEDAGQFSPPRTQILLQRRFLGNIV